MTIRMREQISIWKKSLYCEFFFLICLYVWYKHKVLVSAEKEWEENKNKTG